MTIKPNGGIEYRYERAGAPKLADGKLSGRAAPFDKTTMIGKKPWGFRETISKGAFAKSIKDGDVVLLDNHQHEKPIARQSAGTLVMTETNGGLDWDAEPADTTYANDVRANAKAGNFGGCSFGFEVVRDTWHYNKDDDVDERTLLEVKLHEISVCTFPAYADGTSVTARDQVQAAKEARKLFYEREYGAWVMDGVSDSDERAGKSPYGNVTYADPGYQKDGKKRYPIDTKAHCKAAWSYINKGSNASAYSSKQLASIKSKIKAACKKFGVKVNTNEADMDTTMRTNKTKSGAAVTADLLHVDLRKQLINILGSVDLDPHTRCMRAMTALATDTSGPDKPGKAKKAETKALRKEVKKAMKRALGASSAQTIAADAQTCMTCNGAGTIDGVAACPGGCSGTGKMTDPGENSPGTDSAGDNKGAKQDSSFGLGLNPGANSGANVPTTGTNSNKLSGEVRDDGQPDASTDPEGDADTARRMRAVARSAQMRREMSDAEAAK